MSTDKCVQVTLYVTEIYAIFPLSRQLYKK